MARKKKERRPNTLPDAIGINNFFQKDTVKFIIGVILAAVGILLLIALVSYLVTGGDDQSLVEHPNMMELGSIGNGAENQCGSMGALISYVLINKWFGFAAFLIPVYMIFAALDLMRAYQVNLLKWFICCAIVMMWGSVTCGEFLTPFFADSPVSPGGMHGLYVSNWLQSQVGTPGVIAILGVVAIIFLTYLSRETIYYIRMALNPTKLVSNKVKFVVNTGDDNNEKASQEHIETVEDPLVYDDPAPQTVEFDPIINEEKEKDKNKPESDEETDDDSAKGKDKEPKMVVGTGKEEDEATDNVVGATEETLEAYDPKKDLENYHYPTLDLLKKYDNDGKPFIDMEEQNANKKRIVQVLLNFGVEISSIKATVGPTITLYEITPAKGVRIAKIRNLEDDIALSLSALGIRIIAPIPGKGTIGIEVPNAKPNIVSMESILNSKKFQESTMELPIALGKTITNEVYMVDLAKIPHLLVAGATGQGKSVGLNAIITSLLYKKHPSELKLVLVDPKKVEFSIYSPIVKHFLAQVPDEDEEPIITDVKKVVRTLKSLCALMDHRYDLLRQARVRDIKEYNKKFKERLLNPDKGHEYMPYIVVVIDEFGDLIMTAGKEIELPIARIAQLARAVGIHMVIATQRPTTTIITGNIKANFPGRMAFKVSAMIDSRTILDRPGANQLIGRGDMLFLNGNEPVRVQCAFVDTPEVERIVHFISQQQGYITPYELPEPIADNTEGEGDGTSVSMGNVDPLFEDAARLVVTTQQGSTSMLQRKFTIGYNRAGRLMDQLEKAGIVGAAAGSKPRTVMIMDETSLEQILNSL
jgi:S-DNA-T family DNA segregation ATPase FtsK/SpoIIIE